MRFATSEGKKLHMRNPDFRRAIPRHEGGVGGVGGWWWGVGGGWWGEVGGLWVGDVDLSETDFISGVGTLSELGRSHPMGSSRPTDD